MSITLFILLPLRVFECCSIGQMYVCIKKKYMLYAFIYSGLCLTVKPFNAIRCAHTYIYTKIFIRMRQKNTTHLTKSGRRSNTFGCACFNVFDGDMTTVHANTSSVDNSMGCEGVLSSGVYKIVINMEILLTHTYHIKIFIL